MLQLEINEVENGFVVLDQAGSQRSGQWRTAWVAKDPADLATLIEKLVRGEYIDGKPWQKVDASKEQLP